MIDAVDSGGYGVLGLYAAQAPAVAEPPPAPKAAPSPDAPVVAVPAAQEAAAVGSPPVAASEAGSHGAPSEGRSYADEGQAGARQTAVTASLAAATAAPTTLAGDVAEASPGRTSAASTGRALRAYARSGDSAAAERRAGAMLTASA